MNLPSGEKAGSASDTEAVFVSWVSPLPSGFTDQMSPLLTKAILPLGPGFVAEAEGAATRKMAAIPTQSAAGMRLKNTPSGGHVDPSAWLTGLKGPYSPSSVW